MTNKDKLGHTYGNDPDQPAEFEMELGTLNFVDASLMS